MFSGSLFHALETLGIFFKFWMGKLGSWNACWSALPHLAVSPTVQSGKWVQPPASGFLGSQSQGKFTFCLGLHCAVDGGTEEVWYLGCKDKNDP